MVSLLYTLLFLSPQIESYLMKKYFMGPFCSKRKILKSSTEPPRSFWIWHLPIAFQPLSAPTLTSLCSNYTKILGFPKTGFLCFVLAVLSAENALSTSPLTLLENCYLTFSPQPPTFLSAKSPLRQAQGGTLLCAPMALCSPTLFSLSLDCREETWFLEYDH